MDYKIKNFDHPNGIKLEELPTLPKDLESIIIDDDMFDKSNLLIKYLPKSIKQIRFHHTDCDNWDFSFLEHLPNLEYLKFDYDLSDDYKKHNLSKIKLPVSLKELYCNYMNLKSFKFLKHLTNLNKLELFANGVQRIRRRDLPSNLEELYLAVPTGSEYFLSSGRVVTYKLKRVNILKHLTKLKRLEIIYDSIEKIDEFFFPESLEYIHMRGDSSNLITINLINNKNLKTFSISCTKTIKDINLPNSIEKVYISGSEITKKALDKIPKQVIDIEWFSRNTIIEDC